ncbi:helix-turn-helix domain-containing protein [Mycobacterium antarcticum]|uniref:transcriptional regulator n=1 Tax=Mycolicibacterium sp. TUM20984 TaxID=3023368 RepID=UPI002387EA36|nr:transcriptional regulator [Mycolicibacterium sp. TUM20984]GLP80953.1 hypothetical protein TUM20984_23730 [Mycolicibacterium sp. TUM20984]
MTEEADASPGRPRAGHFAVEAHLHYPILAKVLGVELGKTVQTRARRAQPAGRKWATRTTASKGAAVERVAAPPDDADEPLDRTALRSTVVVTPMGFAAELETADELAVVDGHAPTAPQERIIRLQPCPVRELARSHPGVGCGIHSGPLQGLLADNPATDGRRKAPQPPRWAYLELFVEPEPCLARLVAG